MNDFLFRVIRLAGDDGNLTKKDFFKILRSSDFFMKCFDKNKDGVVTEVGWVRIVKISFFRLCVMVMKIDRNNVCTALG